ncbi:MAG: ABC transporter substrate-binding protein [Nitrosopumilus sp.]
MKSTHLLSVVFSLIMFTGVTAGSTAFADTDELENKLEDFCEMSLEQQSDFFTDYPDMAEYDEKLSTICEISDEDEREDALDDFIFDIILTREDVEDDFNDEFDKLENELENDVNDNGTEVENDREEIDDRDDKYDRHTDLDDRLENFCNMTDEDKHQFFADHPRLKQFSDRLTNYCDLSEDEREDKIDDFIREYVPEARDHDKYDLDNMLERFCDVTDEDKQKFFDNYPRLEQFSERILNYCEMSEDERDDAIDKFVEEHRDEIKDKYSNSGTGDLRDHFAMYCDMTSEKRAEKMRMHTDLPDDLREKLAQYCEMTEDEQDELRDSIKDRMVDFRGYMKDRMIDKPHMDYDRLCSMTSSDRTAEITDSEKLDKISKWCDMTPEEREDYKKEHRDTIKDKMTDKMDKFHDGMKMSDMSPRLKAMIMEKHDISDEKRNEIKMKYREKHGDLTDERKLELKMKFKDHMKAMKIKMSDERRSEIHDRLADMKAFKAELRERASDMTDEEKQQLREEFIEKAKDMQLAWISPRTQITAGIDAAEVECREGFSLVMKASNGVPMCLKADTALKMIDRGIVVPTN